ncbi:MAG: putative porin [Gammaproteobacteria bacterium]|nr:putative porin [Gammaproteobacteria bacterium]
MKPATAVIGAAVIAASSAATAAVSDAEFAEMRAEFAALAQRLNALEVENARLKDAKEQTLRDVRINPEQVAMVGESKSAASWTDRIKIRGDFRYRYESIDVQDDPARDRNRIRARAVIVAQLEDHVEVGLGFATGGDEPTSSNQTLGGGGSTKDLRLDLAYFNWAAVDNLNVIGGKFKNIWYRPQKHGLIWDGDYNPEGIAATFSSGVFFASAGGAWLESDRKKSNTEFSWGTQAGFKGALGGAALVAGVGYYDMDTAGGEPFFGGPSDFFGNSFTCEDFVNNLGCSYVYDYKEIEVFADASMNIAELPVSVFADYVVNDDADENDTGYAVGLKLGKAKSKGSWEVAYIWQDLEADAVLGLLTDSDFGGGGTDAKGHVFKAGYAINQAWKLKLTYFKLKIDGNQGDERDFDRIMLDTVFKY